MPEPVRKTVGWSVHEREDSDLAAVLIRKGAYREQLEPGSLILYSDNGGPMKGVTMMAMLEWLGIVPSFSRPRVSDDNEFSEAQFSTVKNRPEYPTKPFEGLEAATVWIEGLAQWYNHEHLHSATRIVTPVDRHEGSDHAVLGQHKQIYEIARGRNPERSTRETKCWDPMNEAVHNGWKLNVSLNSQAKKAEYLSLELRDTFLDKRRAATGNQLVHPVPTPNAE